MPIIKDRKLIFIHIPKTGGTSVTSYFSGGQDVPTINGKLSPLHSLISDNVEAPGHHPWNWYYDNYPEEWNLYRKVAVVRDPVDRLLSSFIYAQQRNNWWHGTNKDSGLHPDYVELTGRSFGDLLNILQNERYKLKHQSWIPQVNWVYNGDELMVDDLIRYENMNYSFHTMFNITLPYVNVTNQPKFEVTEEEVNIIKEIYPRDFSLLGYGE